VIRANGSPQLLMLVKNFYQPFLAGSCTEPDFLPKRLLTELSGAPMTTISFGSFK
jgi:hypothetical protein